MNAEVGLLQSLATQQQAILLLLTVPFVATVIGIARHIVGIKFLGIYAAIILTYALYGLGLNADVHGYSDIVTGVKYGFIFMFVLIGSTALGSSAIKRTRLHYFPKISIVVSLASLTLLFTILVADLLGRKGFSSTNALALIMIVSIAEQFTAVLFKVKVKQAIILTIETTLLSLFCYVIIAWPSFQEFILRYPFVMIFAFIISFLVGKYRGLRVNEYFRFREILDKPEEEN